MVTGGWDWAFRTRPHSRDPRQQNPAPRLGVIRWRWRWDPAWRIGWIGLVMRDIMAIWLVETVEPVGFRHVFVLATMESKTWMLPDVFLQCRIPQGFLQFQWQQGVQQNPERCSRLNPQHHPTSPNIIQHQVNLIVLVRIADVRIRRVWSGLLLNCRDFGELNWQVARFPPAGWEEWIGGQ